MSHTRNIRRMAKKLRNKMGDKRYFKLLPDITIMQINGKKPMIDKTTEEELICSHEEFIFGRTPDPAFAGYDPRAEPPKPAIWDMRAVAAQTAVQLALDGKKPGDIVELDESVWERLKRATESGTYDPIVARCLMPFMHAICDATLKKPEESKSETKESPAAPQTEASAADPT